MGRESFMGTPVFAYAGMTAWALAKTASRERWGWAIGTSMVKDLKTT